MIHPGGTLDHAALIPSTGKYLFFFLHVNALNVSLSHGFLCYAVFVTWFCTLVLVHTVDS